MKIKYLIFSILFSYYISQNIITSWNYDKVAMYDIQKLNTFLSNEYKITLPITITDGSITINNIVLTGTETNLYDSLINYNNGLLLLTPNKITLDFNFTFSNKNKGYKGTASLELKILTFKLKVENDKKTQKAKFSVKMSTTKENYFIPSITGIEDKDFLNTLQDLLFQGFNDNLILSKVIPADLETKLYNYYTTFYSNKKEFKLVTSDFFGNLGFSMKNNKFTYFCEDPLGEYKTAFCYIEGYPSLDEDNRDKTKVPLKNEKFSHNADSYMIFINKDLVQYIFDYIVNSELKHKSKIYDENVNVKQLDYDFTVASLQKYFEGLDKYESKDIFYCAVYIENITLNQVIFRVQVKNKNKDETYFEMRITSNIAVNIPITKSVRINFCLSKTNTQKVDILTPQVSIKNLDKLKAAIDGSFDFVNNPICINDNYISLRDYFSNIRNIYNENEGIYLEGDQLYQ